MVMKSNCRIFLLGLIAISGLILVELMLDVPWCAASEQIIVATANDNVRITQEELDRVTKNYQRKSRKETTTKEEKIKLIQNLIRRQLILQQDETNAFRIDAKIKQKVKSYEDSLIISKYLSEKIGRHLNPTEQELKAYYRNNRHRFSAPAKVEARHVLLRTRREAEEIMKKLKQGEDFVQLAKDYSIDLPLAREGGQMARYPIPKGEALPELDEVLFMLAEGETSQILETEYGFHIVRIDKIIPPSFKPFEEVKEEIKKQLTRQLHNEAYEEMAAQLEKSADIVIFEDRIN
jgi:peptidyl-prolyl cis-trans isomerase C